jgi:NodT family efflux transporter outer membrane factor (OMF) lipoprotein
MRRTIDHLLRRTLLLWAVVLGGCPPKLAQGPARSVELQLPRDGTAGGPSSASLPYAELIDDPSLVALIDEALAHNQELALLDQEIAEARAELRARRGEVLPRVGVTAGVGVERVGRYTSQGASDADDEILPGQTVPEVLGGVDVGFVASWEVDLYRRLRNASKAARHRYLASIEGRNFAVTRLVAEVADAYYELVALDNELDVIEQNIELQSDSLQVLRRLKAAGRVTELAVQRFEADLLGHRSRRLAILQAMTATENELHLLLGRLPQPIERASEGFVDTEPVVLVRGAASELLVHRPDVRAAEAELEAARLDVKAARAAFYPSLGLDAEVGVESFEPRFLLDPESVAWGLAGRVFAPLINRSDLRARYDASNARQIAAVVAYERAVLGAWLEVATRMSLVRTTTESLQLRRDQVERLEAAVETSDRLFRSARADYLEVLTTRREALESKLELIETRRDQMRAVVDTYQALGGGWRATGGEG